MICNKCKDKKEEEDFSFKNKKENKRSTICKICQREYKIKYYNENKESHYKRNELTENKIKEYLISLKSKGCFICKEQCIACLDFHHRIPSEKEFNMAHIFLYGSMNKAMIEANKCIILCANCHRKLHAGIIKI